MGSPWDRFTGADAAKFVDVKTWGKSATYTPNGGSAAAINVSFAEPFDLAAPAGVEVNSTMPAALCRSSDLSNSGRGQKNETLVIDGAAFYVMHGEPDGHGHTTLFLSRHQV